MLYRPVNRGVASAGIIIQTCEHGSGPVVPVLSPTVVYGGVASTGTIMVEHFLEKKNLHFYCHKSQDR